MADAIGSLLLKIQYYKFIIVSSYLSVDTPLLAIDAPPLSIDNPPPSVDNPLPICYYISIAIIWHPYKKATAAPHLHQAVRTVDLGGTYEKIIFEITISKRNYTPFKGKIQPTLYPPI